LVNEGRELRPALFAEDLIVAKPSFNTWAARPRRGFVEVGQQPWSAGIGDR
jgi:hypothetical protein